MDQNRRKTLPASPAEPADTAGTGKDELNLAEFPIALLTEKAPHGVRTLEFSDQIFDGGKKKLLNRKLTIEGSETYGLPTAKDDEVILGLIQLSKRKRFHDRVLHFTRFELISLLGWPNTGQSYARIELALRRWVSVTLHYENAWWDKSEERWTSGAFHIIDDFELNDSRETTPQMTLLQSRIIWSSRVFGSFVEGHLKNIRYDVYVSLRSAVSKRMYRFLDKRFHHAKSCSFDLRDFAHEHIGLSRTYRDCGKLKEKLDAGIKELERVGFLEAMADDDRYQHEGRGRWKITFKRRVSPATTDASPAAELITALVTRGVSQRTAGDLTKRYAAEVIARQIDVADWLRERKDTRIGRSIAGFLVKSIVDGYAVPDGYTSREERERIAAARENEEREAAEQRRREHEQKAREEAVRQAVAAYWVGLSAAEQKTLEATAESEADPEQLAREHGPLKRMGRQIRRDLHIRRLLIERGELTPDEEPPPRPVGAS